MLKVSFGNRKLPKDTLIFNLPARMTCPGKTELCSRVCYALKAERQYTCPVRNVLTARMGNLEASRRLDFTDQISDQIQKGLKNIKRVRIHESGDFYNQAYLDKWYEIAHAFPELRFYAYTKSFNLDFSTRPANFWLIASLDSSTTSAQLARYKARERFFQNSFTIVDRGTRATCPGDCSICSKCWTRTGLDITVAQH